MKWHPDLEILAKTWSQWFESMLGSQVGITQDAAETVGL